MTTTLCPDAERLLTLIRANGLTVAEAAGELGLDPGDGDEQLRLLALPEGLQRTLAEAGLTRRHALELLRIPDSRLRDAALVEMAYLRLPPEDAGRYVDSILPPVLPTPVRDFLIDLSRSLDALRAAGCDAELLREDADNLIKLTLRLPIT